MFSKLETRGSQVQLNSTNAFSARTYFGLDKEHGSQLQVTAKKKKKVKNKIKSYRTTTDQQYPTYVFYCLSIFQKVTMVKEDRKKTKGGRRRIFLLNFSWSKPSPTAAAPLQLGRTQRVLSSTCQVLTTSCIQRSAGLFAVLHCHASVNVFLYP